MPRLICLKCGSADIDNGSTFLLSLLGAGLLITSMALMICKVYCQPVVNWCTYVPDLTFAIPAIVGVYALFKCAERSEHVTCRRCGTVWTPPQRP